MSRRQSAVHVAVRAAAAVLVLAVLAACAPRTAPRAPLGAPRYPEFVFPAVPLDLAGSAVLEHHQGAWLFLQAGDLRAAERGFAAALRQVPDFYPAEAGLGYVELAQRDYRNALARFDRALSMVPSYVPALVGRGEVLLAAGREAEALASLETALAVDGSLADVGRRVEVLRFRQSQQQVALARQAADAGRYDEARQAYQQAIAASPESAFLYRELAAVERRQGDAAQALEHARKAAELDPQDPRGLILLGELFEATEQFEAAETAYVAARRLDPGAGLDDRLERLRERARLAQLPPEYAAIPGAPAITRGELAALIGVRLEHLLAQSSAASAIVITDTRGHWAAPWILSVARAGILEVYPNHTFQPAATVRRGDLAQAMSRLLNLLGTRDPALVRSWRNARPAFADLGPGHLNYPAAALSVEAGVLPVLDGGTFQLNRPVTGEEVVAALNRIEALARRLR